MRYQLATPICAGFQVHKSLTLKTLVSCKLEESLRVLDQQLECTAEQCTEQHRKVQSLKASISPKPLFSMPCMRAVAVYTANCV